MADEAIIKINVDDEEYLSFVKQWQKFKKQQIKEEKSKKGLTGTLTQGFKKVQNITKSVIKGFAGIGGAIGGAVVGVFSFVKAITSAVRKNYELARGVGTTTRNVETMQEAFRKSGIGGDAGQILATMRNAQLDLTSQARPLLARYGVEGEGDTQKQFLQLLDKIVNSGISNSVKLQDLQTLGLDAGSAQSMLTNDGYQRFLASLKEAENESTMNEGRAQRMRAFDEQVERLKKSFANLAQLAAEHLIPYLDRFAKYLTNLVRTKGKDIIEGTIEALKTFASFIKKFVDWIADSAIGKWIMGDEWAEKREKEKLQESQDYKEAKEQGIVTDEMTNDQAKIAISAHNASGMVKDMSPEVAKQFEAFWQRQRAQNPNNTVNNNVVINVADAKQAGEAVESISNSSLANPKRIQTARGL